MVDYDKVKLVISLGHSLILKQQGGREDRGPGQYIFSWRFRMSKSKTAIHLGRPGGGRIESGARRFFCGARSNLIAISSRFVSLYPVAILLFLATLTTGCGSMLPQAHGRAESPWHSFEQAKAAFDKVIPNQTSKDDLHKLAFDPFKNPNIEIMTYLDLANMFMPNSSFQKEDIAQEVRECMKAQDKCYGYRLIIENIKNRRYGNVFLDLFKFKRKSRKTGWYFKAVLVLQDDLVVYKIWGGKPLVEEYEYQKNPLGPLQESGGALRDVAVDAAF